MKIFIPFELKDIGGPTSFVTKFKLGLEKRGHEVTLQETPDYDILFLIVQAPFKYILKAKKRKIPIVQRLDGVYYWSVASWKFPLFNLKALIIRHLFADYTVYQSKYSKYCVNKFLGKKKNEISEIIYNGVDTTVFTPHGSTLNLRDTPDQKIFFTASAFRRKDQILPLFEALTHYQENYPTPFKFLIAGTFSHEVTHTPQEFAHFKNAVFLGKIDNSELPLYERSVDVFLFTHLNPPCPNNVIEALACGLPICGISDGAMQELVTEDRDGKLLVAPGHAFWEKRDFSPVAFAKQLDTILQKKEQLSRGSRTRAVDYFSLEKMIEQYIDFLTKIKD